MPAAGNYAYSLTGGTQGILLGPPPTDPAGSSLTINVSQPVPQSAGSQVTLVATSPQAPAQISTTYLYGATEVALTSSTLSYAGLANYPCSYTPPLEFLPNPLVAGALVQQSWSNSGCSGSLSVDVLGADSVTAAGRIWPVWRVHTVLQEQTSGLSATMDTTAAYSSTLGTLVSADASTTGNLSGQAFTTQEITMLTGYPAAG